MLTFASVEWDTLTDTQSLVERISSEASSIFRRVHILVPLAVPKEICPQRNLPFPPPFDF